MEEKNLLRRRLRAQRSALPEAQRRAWDARILRHLTGMERLQRADAVLLYLSCRGEADTHALFGWLTENGIRAALPLCGQDGTMDFVQVQDLSALHPGAYGIPEPAPGVCPALTPASVCIVPGVAFTRGGVRLGQGGGYYDRFLAAHEGLYTVGLCYEALVQPQLPEQPHDRRVDALVTETGIYL